MKEEIKKYLSSLGKKSWEARKNNHKMSKAGKISWARKTEQEKKEHILRLNLARKRTKKEVNEDVKKAIKYGGLI